MTTRGASLKQKKTSAAVYPAPLIAPPPGLSAGTSSRSGRSSFRSSTTSRGSVVPLGAAIASRCELSATSGIGAALRSSIHSLSTLLHGAPPASAPHAAAPALSPGSRYDHVPIDKSFRSPTRAPLKCLSPDPGIYTIDGFLSNAECDALIAQGELHLEPSVVVGGSRTMVSRNRTSSSCYLRREDAPFLVKRISRLLCGKNTTHLELPQVARYYSGQAYAPHQDSFETSQPGGFKQHRCVCCCCVAKAIQFERFPSPSSLLARCFFATATGGNALLLSSCTSVMSNQVVRWSEGSVPHDFFEMPSLTHTIPLLSFQALRTSTGSACASSQSAAWRWSSSPALPTDTWTGALSMKRKLWLRKRNG